MWWAWCAACSNGWWLVGIAVVLLTLMALSVFQGLGTFLVALQREFGWSRTVLSGAFSLSRAQGAVIGAHRGMAHRQGGQPAHDTVRLPADGVSAF